MANIFSRVIVKILKVVSCLQCIYSGLTCSDSTGDFRMLGIRRGNLHHQNTRYVYFLGYVHYNDELGIVRKMAVLRHYNTETGRFILVDDPDYEYAD